MTEVDQDPEPTTSSVEEDADKAPSDSEEEEYECRVCRGPVEEGRPLFSPCKCSGSIGLVHQDCLTSWLSVTRGEGRCELCKVKFHFAPRYAENAPERLSVSEVLLGLSRSAVARWLPFLLRLAFCLSLWLVIAPLSTAYLYHLWVKRSLSRVIERWTWQLLPADTVSGAVLMTIILVSFLSLMSFADFLRVEWQQQHRVDPPEPEPRIRREAAGNGAEEENNRQQNEVDNALLDRLNELRARRDTQQQQQQEQEIQNDDVQVGTDPKQENQGDNNNVENSEQAAAPDENAENVAQNEGGNGGEEDDNNNNANAIEERMRQEAEENNNADQENQNNDNAHPQPPRDNARVVPPRPDRRLDAMDMDPPLPEDQVDMEINVALDELLGLRGPLSSLLRNLLWLLVFNTIYLGFFTFVPRTIGSAVYSTLFNTTAFEKVESENATSLTLVSAIALVNDESEKRNTVFQLSDFAAVNLGYFFCAGVVILIRYSWLFLLKFRRLPTSDNHGMPRVVPPQAAHGQQDEDVHGDPAGRIGDAGIGDHDFNRRQAAADRLEHPGIALGEAVGLILDATIAVVKVGILLFLKMFLLPVLLGIWLDASSMDLFGSSAEDRVVYAGRDVFSFILLHWVAGITFMLLVTVSVLQLREVAHADLLAHLIRPQEPQPDLLGNLLHDSVFAQTKRMLLSLGIYTVLLVLHVSLPVQILTTTGISELMPFLKLRFWYMIMPQLQVPLELLFFHLSMLALLERYKNSIGEMQHHWLVFMCSRMGLSQYMLPHDIEKFALVGYIPVSAEDSNQSLHDLASGEGDHEELIRENMKNINATLRLEIPGETRENGERVLKETHAFIALPSQSPSGTSATDESGASDGVVLLPTKLGRFRLKKREDPTNELAIEIWEEVSGKPIPRPPEGWDDLGAGGADIQGRWAWGKEKQSGIEHGVAHRPRIFGPCGLSNMTLANLTARFIVLLFLSWCATTCLLVSAVATPLGVGRLVFFFLRVPDTHIHMPWLFAIGSLLAFPIMARGGSLLMSSSDSSVSESLIDWIGSMRLPPQRKGRVVLLAGLCWFVLCPLALGLSYELCLIKSAAWFAGEEVLMDTKGFFLSWMVGSILLNTWACCCSLSVFTKEFWVNLGNGIVEIEGENQRGRRENGAQDQQDQGPRWQGKDGKVAKFFAVWKSVIVLWEWDTVDHEVLLNECAIPVSKSLGLLLLAPSLCYSLWFGSIQATIGLSEISGILRLYIFRLASASTLLLQLCHAFRSQIQRWFSAVHKTARDDRYLIGEILLNYQPVAES
ncbi:ERAD-associated E3 ubiquitin-protein ligase DOA10 [Seminavis robusta]|uniref:RING-type E3 ubiquitin transferase n=1 Tax=Seminavis robusta TaxID=568900 RepID=A0A9N8H8M0_9STRA|nr:ERAD-associated E3 ubiquitin-protein ligase DOA10 [Seminavis robusta]|eukprot:Sro245_g097490.1 ERAD-associated E3 ubiquitin-protein ligase DOA10 (1288) ;mRNA; f:56844-61228